VGKAHRSCRRPCHTHARLRIGYCTARGRTRPYGVPADFKASAHVCLMR
jgi:hypothetical protein